MSLPLRLFIGVDHRERAAANVLIDSLVQHSSAPLAITPLLTPQLERQGLHRRPRDPLQSSDFSFTRFLVPHLCGYDGWALFLDCDMLCRGDIAELWALRDEACALMCVQHHHVPRETVKFLGEPQSAYDRKNWSSLMLFNTPAAAPSPPSWSTPPAACTCTASPGWDPTTASAPCPASGTTWWRCSRPIRRRSCCTGPWGSVVP